MLATDNHIGYLERDPIRGQDSINTFREILQLAVKHDVSSWGWFLRSLGKEHNCRNLSFNKLAIYFGDVFSLKKPGDC
jgi:hypothetical protein